SPGIRVAVIDHLTSLRGIALLMACVVRHLSCYQQPSIPVAIIQLEVPRHMHQLNLVLVPYKSPTAVQQVLAVFPEWSRRGLASILRQSLISSGCHSPFVEPSTSHRTIVDSKRFPSSTRCSFGAHGKNR